MARFGPFRLRLPIGGKSIRLGAEFLQFLQQLRFDLVAKRKKRKQKPRKQTQLKLPPEVILQRAETELEAGRPQRAREGFRRLFQQDPEKYRARYVEITKQLVDLHLDQGTLGEVGILLDQLEEIGVEPSQLRARRLRLAIETRDAPMLAEFADDLMESSDPVQRIAVADALVLGGGEAAAVVLSAITHLCRCEWEAMRNVLKSVGRKSMFAHWRLFLRGCAASYSGHSDEADACFGRLPADSVPARKAAAFKILHGHWLDVDEETVADACLLAGEPALAKCLPTAQHYWMRDKYAAAYQTIRRGVRDFPSLQVNARGQLTRFFQLVDTDMADEKRQRWLDSILGGNLIKSLKMDAEGYMVTNILARSQFGSSDHGLIADAWDRYQKIRRKVRGNNARFTAFAHMERANADNPEAKEMNNFYSCIPFKDYGAMIQSLQASAKADPEFEEPALALLELYHTHGRRKEANRLLDEMTKRFPSSKTVLLKAGQACLDRNASAKGLAYLERARLLDPLDAGIQSQIRRGLREQAVAAFKKGSSAQRTKGRQIIGQLLDSLPHHAPLGESRNDLLIWWSVLEDLKSPRDDSLATEKFAEASRELSAHVAEFCRVLQVALLLPAVMGARWTKIPLPNIRGTRSLEQGLVIYRLWANLDANQQESAPCELFEWIMDYLKVSFRKLRNKDLKLARQLADELRKDEDDWDILADDLVKKCLKLDRSDPYFNCLSWTCGMGVIAQPERIEKTKEEARRRNDQASLDLIARYEELNQGATPFDNFNPFDTFDSEPHLDAPTEMPSKQVLREIEACLLDLPPAEHLDTLFEAGFTKIEADMILFVLGLTTEEPATPKKKRARKSSKKKAPKKKATKKKVPKKKVPKKKAATKKPKPANPENDSTQFELPF